MMNRRQALRALLALPAIAIMAPSAAASIINGGPHIMLIGKPIPWKNYTYRYKRPWNMEELRNDMHRALGHRRYKTPYGIDFWLLKDHG